MLCDSLLQVLLQLLPLCCSLLYLQHQLPLVRLGFKQLLLHVYALLRVLCRSLLWLLLQLALLCLLVLLLRLR